MERPEKKDLTNAPWQLENYREDVGYNQACEKWEAYHEERIKEIREEHQRQTRGLQAYWEMQATILLGRR